MNTKTDNPEILQVIKQYIDSQGLCDHGYQGAVAIGNLSDFVEWLKQNELMELTKNTELPAWSFS